MELMSLMFHYSTISLGLLSILIFLLSYRVMRMVAQGRTDYCIYWKYMAADFILIGHVFVIEFAFI